MTTETTINEREEENVMEIDRSLVPDGMSHETLRERAAQAYFLLSSACWDTTATEDEATALMAVALHECSEAVRKGRIRVR